MDIYGKIRKLEGAIDFVPFRYQGQYEDVESGLYYNRFRYYDSISGNYISQDPIGLASGEPNFYAYVKDSNSWVDIFGLSECNLKGRNTPAWKARGWQGSGDYPGIDKWRTKNLKKGSIVYGGVPGQSEFYLSQKSLNLANGSKERLWKSAQVKPHDIYGYRSQVQAYEVLEDVDIGFSIVEANMQHGAGKAEQIFIENFGKVLKPIGNPIPLI